MTFLWNGADGWAALARPDYSERKRHIEDETAGYIGGEAIADLEGLVYLPPAVQSITYRPGGEVENDGRHAFEWDPAGRLTRTTSLVPGLPLDVQHTYDGHDRRVRKIVTRGEQVRDHRYVYDGWLPVAEEIRDGLGNLRATRVYVWGPGDDGVRDTMDGPAGRLAAIAHTENGVTRVSYPVYNWRHDVIALIDAHSGAVVARYEYEAFGRRTATGPRAGDCPFGFATAHHDETGHVYFGYRHYDPEMKQWLSRDPFGERGGFNLYAYANGDPVNYVDTLGLWGKRLDDVDFRIHRGVPQVLMRARRQTWAKGSARAF